MKTLIHVIQKHSSHVIKHVRTHRHKYVFGLFGGVALIKTFLLVAGLFGSVAIIQHYASANFADPVATCSGVTEIPEYECVDLLNFYNATNGDSRYDNSNWGNTGDIASWTGITLSASKVSIIALSGNNLSGSLPSGVFSGMRYLATLNLIGNHITSIESGAFVGVTGCIAIYMSNNVLTGIEYGDFAGLSGLYTLSLRWNNIANIESGSFADAHALNDMDLSHNQLTELKNGDFAGISGSWSIYLDHNTIVSIESGAFANTLGLRSIYLGYNQITGLVGGMFSGLTTLHTIDLFDNDITTIEDSALTALPGLHELYLTQNNISTIGSGIFAGAPNLENIYLNSNTITSIPSNTFSSLNALKYLALQQNDISTVAADSLGQLPVLYHLDLSYNDITTIDSGTFVGLSGLQYFDVSNNKITSIQSNSYGQFPLLTYFSIGDNKISNVPGDFFSLMPNVQSLSLRSNYNTTLPEEMTGLTHLVTGQLDIRFNRLCTGTISPTLLSFLNAKIGDTVWQTKQSNQNDCDRTPPQVGTGYILSGATGYNNPNNYYKGTIDIRADVSQGGNWLSGATCEYTTGSLWALANFDTDHCDATNLNPQADINIQFRIQDTVGITGTGATGAYIYDVFYPASAVAPLWSRATQGGGTGNDQAFLIQEATGGKKIVLGAFQNASATFGTTTVSNSGSWDIYVASISSTGQWGWVATAGGTGYDIAYMMDTDSSGNIYVAGHYQYEATFGTTTLSNSGGYDIFVAKLSPAGQWLRAVRAGGSGDNQARGITVDAAGNVHMAGYYNSAMTFDSIPLTGYDVQWDAYVAELSSTGQRLRATRAGGVSNDAAYGVSADASGNTYVVGTFQDTIHFAGISDLVANGPYDSFVGKLSSTGQRVWSYKFGGGGSDLAYDIKIDNDGNNYIAGSYDSFSVTLGSTTLSNSGGNLEGFIGKVSSTGQWLRANKIGGQEDDALMNITLDAQKNSYVAGYFSGIVSFGGQTITSSGGTDGLIAKISSTGQALRIRQVGTGGTGNDRANGIDLDAAGNISTVGFFANTISFTGAGLTSLGSNDTFVAGTIPPNMFTINNNDYSTTSADVILNINCPVDTGIGGTEIAYGNTSGATNRTGCAATKSRILTTGAAGTRTVYMRTRDAFGNISPEYTDDIEYNPPFCDTVVDVPPVECYSLMNLYNETNGPGRTTGTNWGVSTTVGSWYGILLNGAHVSQLTLGNNHLSGALLSGELSGLSNLIYFDLTSNYISSIERQAFTGLSNLGSLYIYGSHLSSIASGAFLGLSNLKTLALQQNNLTAIESGTFAGLSSLTTLVLHVNHIGSIEEGDFYGMPALNNLSLGYNLITSIESGDLTGMPTLKSLWLPGNNITSIESDDLYGVAELTGLDLSFNDLTGVDNDDFSLVPALIELDLDENNISTIASGGFSNLPSIQILKLNNNVLPTLPGTMTGLTTLTTGQLYLDHNKICTGGLSADFLTFLDGIAEGGIGWQTAQDMGLCGTAPTVGTGYIILGSTGYNMPNNYYKGAITIRADVVTGTAKIGATGCMYSVGGGRFPAFYHTGYCEVLRLMPDVDISIVFSVTDLSGATSAGGTGVYLYDGTPPQGLNFVINSGDVYTTGTSATLNITCPTDTGVNATMIAYGNTAGPTNRTSCLATKPRTLSGGDGTQTVYMRTKDALDNISTYTDTIILDTSAPTVGTGFISSGATGYNSPNYYYKGTVNIRANVSDGGAGLSGATCQYTTGVSRAAATYHTTYCEVTGLVYMDDIYIQFRIEDQLGILGTGGTGTYIYDNVAPEGLNFMINGGALYASGTSVTLNITCPTDTGVAGTQIAYNNIGGAINRTSCTATKPRTLASGDGVQGVYMRTRDALGNITNEYTDGIILDTTAPEITVTYSTTGRTSGDIIATLSGNEDITGCSISGYVLTGMEYTFTGNGPFEFICYDLAGNTGSVTGEITRFDDIPPTYSGVISGDTYYTGVVITYDDNNPGVTGTLNGDPYISGTVITDTGDYILIITDLAGNEIVIAFTIEDAICGNAIIETGAETCDEGSGLNGQTGHCNFTCNGTVPTATPPPSNPSGGPTVLPVDYCPDGDYSQSYYDGICGTAPTGNNGSGGTGVIHASAGDCIPGTGSDELSEAYARAYELGITTSCPISEAHLDRKILRRQMAKMISQFAVSVLKQKPDTGINCSFPDLSDQTAEIKSYIVMSCQLHMMGWQSDGKSIKKTFDPNETVDRAQFGTILSRMLRDGKYNTTDYSYWYKNHLKALKDHKIMDTINQPFVDELRGSVMIMLMRSSKMLQADEQLPAESDLTFRQSIKRFISNILSFK